MIIARNSSCFTTGSEASQAAPDLKSSRVKVDGISASGNPKFFVSLFCKVGLQFHTASDQTFRRRQQFLRRGKVDILTVCGLFIQVVDDPSQFFQTRQENLKQFLGRGTFRA
ncbi:hypothetical protein [Aestuariivita boseongensis]|uniref:hypothetical protein n=1 Tax=Aestuariivita boseongensis TaxID=1470562 RepID=UPI00155D91EE|nr:hypothetical protein [Aestuariivita boseongensis]